MEVFWKKKTSPANEAKKKNFTNLRSKKKNFAAEGSEEKNFNPTPLSGGKMVFFEEKKLHPPVRLKKKTSSIWGLKKKKLRRLWRRKKQTSPDPNFHAPPENLMVRPLEPWKLLFFSWWQNAITSTRGHPVSPKHRQSENPNPNPNPNNNNNPNPKFSDWRGFGLTVIRTDGDVDYVIVLFLFHFKCFLCAPTDILMPFEDIKNHFDNFQFLHNFVFYFRKSIKKFKGLSIYLSFPLSLCLR